MLISRQSRLRFPGRYGESARLASTAGRPCAVAAASTAGPSPGKVGAGRQCGPFSGSDRPADPGVRERQRRGVPAVEVQQVADPQPLGRRSRRPAGLRDAQRGAEPAQLRVGVGRGRRLGVEIRPGRPPRARSPGCRRTRSGTASRPCPCPRPVRRSWPARRSSAERPGQRPRSGSVGGSARRTSQSFGAALRSNAYRPLTRSAVQHDLHLDVVPLRGVVAAAVPDRHPPGAVLAGRDVAGEVRRTPSDGPRCGPPAGSCPGPSAAPWAPPTRRARRPAPAAGPSAAAGVVLLDDEHGRRRVGGGRVVGGRHRLRGAAAVALAPVLLEWHADLLSPVIALSITVTRRPACPGQLSASKPSVLRSGG